MIAFLTVGLIVIALIIAFIGKQQRNVNSIMQQNKNVMPLLKMKAAEYKLQPVRVQSSVHNKFTGR